MHEVSLGATLRDYLTGQDVDHTTYEDLRQALARLLVEELGHPRELVEPRVRVRFDVVPDAANASSSLAPSSTEVPRVFEGADRPDAPPVSLDLPVPPDSGAPGDSEDSDDHDEGCRVVDLTLRDDDGTPLCIVLFCPGAPGSYARESVAAARLFPGGPAPLVAVTDTRDALLMAAVDGAVLGEGMRALPKRDALRRLAADHPCPQLTQERAAGERRILGAYTAFLKRCCGEDVCLL
ncbi:type I restriction endonuclease subunit R [Nitratidesulfovibrio liaohensis]|uniref:type I restriction endonuclease subunit R n=1 Tax=Nitratidesulfovibrio liaohensis TaxID=2604158 RepID=UPI00141D93DC|nr:type I restriction endonuclease subunit R [Nitratidesulfovibrio liaohensis]NHZ47629.1 type I restriction endonuclease subunit R [Nitratidesulfovibrio liaohensis]